MADALARGTNIALLDARAQVHHLVGERRGEGLRGLAVFSNAASTAGFG